MRDLMENTINSKFDTPQESLGLLLWQVSTSWRSGIERVLGEFSLTHPQFVVLACLGYLTRNGDKITQANLGQMARIDPNTLSQILRGLERKHLVMRKKSNDARVKNPFLTRKGEELVQSAMPKVEGQDNLFFQSLSSSEQKELQTLFLRLS